MDAPALVPPDHPYFLDDVPTYPLWISKTQREQIGKWVKWYWLLQNTAIEHISATLLHNINETIPRLLDQPPQLVHNSRVGREGLTIASLNYARSHDIPFVFTPNHHVHWKGWFYRHFTQVFRTADAVIVHTPYEANELVRLGVHPDRLTVIGIGPILSPSQEPPEQGALRFRTKFGIPDVAPIVLFLGQKYPYKRFDLVLKAMPEVWKIHPDTFFVFIGPRTPESRRVFDAVNDPHVIELDTVDLNEKTNAIAACSVMCMPSHSESFGGVYVEAWMLNKPVIGGDAPAVRDLITDGVNGYIIGNDSEKLAQRLSQLLSDHAMSLEMGTAGRCIAELYNWETLSSRLRAVYQPLM